MLPAIGAASAAFDAIQSLTSPQPSSSQSSGFASILSGAEDSAAILSSGSAAGGSGTGQTSSGNINALLDAQSLSSADLADALGSGSSSDSSQQSQSASSTYNAINQLTQSAAIPLGLSPVSISA
jgi:uncharacterized protein YkwD